MSSADADAALAPLRAASAKSVPAAVPTYDFGETAFLRLAKRRAELDRFVATHGGPVAVDATTAGVIEKRIERGAGVAHTIADPDDGFYVGHDFGTSSTKVVLRHPYRGFGAAFALDVPAAIAADGQPHLWPTLAFLRRDTGAFALCPTLGAVALAGFKSALIEGQGHRICNGSAATAIEAATGFFALHLAYVLGAFAEREPGSRVAGVNLGVPVAALCEGRARATFDQAVRAALLLLPQAATLTLEDVRIALALDDRSAIPFALHAELSGAIAGYCAQPRRYVGAHMIVDCGSATLDVASFHLGDGDGKVGVYGASVERLGADACASYRDAGASVEDCRGASRHQEYRVFRETLERQHAGFAQDEDRRYPYQVVLIGGGMAGEVHRPLFEGMEPAFARSFHRPALGADLTHDAAADPVRLILADGLARDPIDLREVLMPLDRSTPPKRPEPEPVTKDQV